MLGKTYRYGSGEQAVFVRAVAQDLEGVIFALEVVQGQTREVGNALGFTYFAQHPLATRLRVFKHIPYRDIENLRQKGLLIESELPAREQQG